MIHIIDPHIELIRANRLANIPNDGLGLSPGMHALAIIVALMAPEFEHALAVTPGRDAEGLLLVAVVAADLRELGVVAGVLPARGLPAVLGAALPARTAVADVHGGGDGPADPVEGVDLAGGVGVVFEVHVGGQFGVGVGEEVLVRAEAGGLPDGVEVQGPPGRVPDAEVLEPVAVVDGARVGGVPGLVEVCCLAGGAVGAGGVGLDGGGLVDGFVEDEGGDGGEDGGGAGTL